MRKAGLRPFAAECEPFRTQQPVVEAFAVFHYSFLFLVFLSEFLKFLLFFVCACAGNSEPKSFDSGDRSQNNQATDSLSTF